MRIKYYNHCLIYNVQEDLIIQTGDPTETGYRGQSIFGGLHGDQATCCEANIKKYLGLNKRRVPFHIYMDLNFLLQQTDM